jgi:hypothetical protein
LKITSFVYVYISEKCIVELITECPAKCIIWNAHRRILLWYLKAQG